MKKNVFFLIGAAACTALLSLTACGSDEIDYSRLPKDAKLSLNLQGTGGDDAHVDGTRTAGITRTTGATFPSNESTLKRITVGVFFAGGTTNVIQEVEASKLAGGSTAPDILCTAGNGQTVIVVANAPTGIFAAAATQAEFIAKTVALQQTVGTSSVWQTADNLPMSGQNSVDIVAGSTPTTATVSLSRLVARVSVSSIRTAFDPAGQYRDATFKLTDIYLYNVPATSNVQSDLTLFPVTTAFTAGIDDNGLPVAGSDYLRHALQATAVGGSSGNLINGAPYWFYAFANQEGTKPVDPNAPQPLKLVLKGEFDADGAGSKAAVTMHYPVVINKAQPGTSFTGGDLNNGNANVYRNATYDVTVTIKGKGSDSPEDDVEQAYLTVNVTVAPWALNLAQDVTFE
jgi:hypothetical protein